MQEDKIVPQESDQKELLTLQARLTQYQSDLNQRLSKLSEMDQKIQQPCNRINKSEIVQMKSLKHPAPLILQVMQSLMIIFGSNPKAQWSQAQKLLSNSNVVLQKMKNFRNLLDSKEISVKNMLQVKKIFQKSKQLVPKRVENYSCGAAKICQWIIRCIDFFDFYRQQVVPLIAKNKELEENIKNIKQKHDQKK